MSDDKELSSAEVHQKAYDALRSYRDEWKQIDVDKLVSDGVLKPVRGGYQVLDQKRLPEVAMKHTKSVKQTASGVVIIISKPNQNLLKKIDKFFD
ncbi:hypothetical protein [Klebsiella pasteurii]|uniref:hypothetical protein n=1 Tax=Klebsiella pasteurii TaxID=2587529 RepID=UPI0027FEC0BA|nr:hypothetical protein [Klebsiella variicola]